jgi:hypothetical protein
VDRERWLLEWAHHELPDSESGTQTIAMPWGQPQLRAVKRAAAPRGLPYQLYIRNAAWEAARNDLERAEVVSG